MNDRFRQRSHGIGDRRGGPPIAALSADGFARRERVTLKRGEQRKPVFGLLGECIEQMPDPDLDCAFSDPRN